jgi:hypothetical protein
MNVGTYVTNGKRYYIVDALEFNAMLADVQAALSINVVDEPHRRTRLESRS